jgi:hypothetical protein
MWLSAAASGAYRPVLDDRCLLHQDALGGHPLSGDRGRVGQGRVGQRPDQLVEGRQHRHRQACRAGGIRDLLDGRCGQRPIGDDEHVGVRLGRSVRDIGSGSTHRYAGDPVPAQGLVVFQERDRQITACGVGQQRPQEVLPVDARSEDDHPMCAAVIRAVVPLPVQPDRQPGPHGDHHRYRRRQERYRVRYELLVGEQADQEDDHSDQRRAGGDGDRLVDAAYRMSAAVGPQDRVNGQLGRDGDGDDGQERPRLDVDDREIGPQEDATARANAQQNASHVISSARRANQDAV